MTEDVMAAAEPHLLQVFLSRGGHGVYEVSVVFPSKGLSCTCPGFTHRKKCKHISFVMDKLSEDGEYSVPIPTEAIEKLKEAQLTPASWRAFVIEHVTPEVL